MPKAVKRPQANPSLQKYAGLKMRFLAYSIDFIILIAINVFVDICIYGRYDSHFNILILLIMMVLEIVYYTFFVASKRQATPGKMLLGLKFVDESGRRLTLSKALSRAVLKVISEFLLILGIGLFAFITVAFTKKKQTLYDIILHTYVIKSRANDILEKEATSPVQSTE